MPGMEMLVKAGGVYTFALVVFHLCFWRLFRWKTDLRRLSELNRAVMQVLNVSLTLVFVIFSSISLVHTEELLTTSLGRSLLVLMAFFWLARSVQQAVFFGVREWRSVAFLLYFLAGTVLYAIPAVAGG